jgi:hypothetical protein
MAKFIITINRRPWNKSAEYILQDCQAIINDPGQQGITDIDSFADRIQRCFDFWAMSNGKNPDAISISTFHIQEGRKALGVNRANSTEGCAFIVKLDTDEPQAEAQV